MTDQKILLPESQMPTHWFNLAPSLPVPLPPPLNPATKQPAGPEELAVIFPMGLLAQEMSAESWIEIPEEVQQVYKLYRPTPLMRARRLEKALDTPAHIYYKWEGVSPPGSHKPNTAIAQAYYNKQEGVRRLATETGAGQWGSALAMACKFFGLECMVYMVKVSYHQKPYRRSLMQAWGAEVIPSPSDRTEAGKKVLAEHPDSPGSLGIAISEAIEDAVKHPDTKYSLGSVLNHVLLHQTIIGQEAKKQLEMADAYPDVVIGCHGGGSNLAGVSFVFVKDKIDGKKVRVVAVEPTACPSLTKGIYAYDFGDTAETTPLIMMKTLGHDFIPAGIHAGGLRYHGAAPLVSLLVEQGLIEAVAYHQNPVFESATLFAQTEGILPAPEAAHAVKAAVDEATLAKQAGEKRTILFNMSGHGYFDMAAYDDYLAGKLEDYEHPDAEIKKAMERIPVV